MLFESPDQSGEQDRRHRGDHPPGAGARGADACSTTPSPEYTSTASIEVDLYLHSLTKFVSGHGDVMGGAAIGTSGLIRALRTDFTLLGGMLDPHAAFLMQRGLKTYFVRYQAQCASAQRIAEYLAASRAVERTHYPGLADICCARAGARSDERFRCGGDLRSTRGCRGGTTLCRSLQLFSMTASLGATESLVMPPQMLGSRDSTMNCRRPVASVPAPCGCRSVWRTSTI